MRLFWHRYHPYKVLTEHLVRKIILRVHELMGSGKMLAEDVPAPVFALFSAIAPSYDEFLRIDDDVVIGEIRHWAESKDDILSTLSSDLLFHEKNFTQLCLMNQTAGDTMFFQRQLLHLLNDQYSCKKAGLEVSKEIHRLLNKTTEEREITEWFKEQHFWIEETQSSTLYDSQKTIGCCVEMAESPTLARFRRSWHSAPRASFISNIGASSSLKRRSTPGIRTCWKRTT